MKMKDVKTGMKVLVLPSACKAKYNMGGPGWADEMNAYVGTIRTVSGVYSGGQQWVDVGAWVFKAEDLQAVSEGPTQRKKDILKQIKKLVKELENLD